MNKNFDKQSCDNDSGAVEIMELGRCIRPKLRHEERYDIYQVNRHAVVVEQRQDQREVVRVEKDNEASKALADATSSKRIASLELMYVYMRNQ